METNKSDSGFVVYQSNKYIGLKPAHIIVIFDATGLYRWADWVLLAPDVKKAGGFGGIGYKLDADMEGAASIISADLLKSSALNLGCSHLSHRIHDQSPELFRDLYQRGYALEFAPANDSRRALLELVLLGTDDDRNLIGHYKEASSTSGLLYSEAFSAEVTAAYRIWGKFPSQNLIQRY